MELIPQSRRPDIRTDLPSLAGFLDIHDLPGNQQPLRTENALAIELDVAFLTDHLGIADIERDHQGMLHGEILGVVCSVLEPAFDLVSKVEEGA
jgi:hypothetical protein